ncbi:MAG: electron transporter RnfD, partial [Bariatricus sp.]
KIQYNPELGDPVEWNFTEYTPQVVIVAIGQNDNHPYDYMKEDYDGEKAVVWRKHYSIFLRKLRKQYPDAQIICCTTLLQHDAAWDRSIAQVVHEIEDSKITQYIFKRNGKGTPGHLRILEAEEMADELAAYIETLEIEGWE